VNLMRHPKEQFDDHFYLLDKIGELWLYGYPVSWQALTGEEEAQRISLPTYPFEPTRYWIDKDLNDFTSSNAHELMKSKEISDWFYQPAWVREPNRKVDLSGMLQKCLLITDGSDFAAGLETALKQQQAELAKTLLSAEMLLSDEEVPFRQLISEIADEAQDHFRIVWVMPDVLRDDATRISWTRKGFGAIVDFVKSFTTQFPFANAEITIVTRNIHNVTGLEQNDYLSSTMLAPITVMQQEYPTIKSGNLDISRSEEDLPSTINRVLQEVILPSDHLVAVRGGKSWSRQFKKLKTTSNSELEFRENGTYLVTGGLGRIGFTILHEIAKKYSPNLYITGNTPLVERSQWEDWLSTHGKDNPASQRINKIKMLEAEGATVT
ncbi:MAG: hypothetical protein AAFO69_07140, partial [Bacteroidota bacterium]